MKNNNSNLKNSEIGKKVKEDKQKNSTEESIKKNEEINLAVGQQKDNTREKQMDKEDIIKPSVAEKPLKYDNSDSKEDSKSAKGEEKTSEQQKHISEIALDDFNFDFKIEAEDINSLYSAIEELITKII